jgi:general stress protein 26
MDQTTSHSSHADGVKKVAEIIKDLRMAMLVTIDERGLPNSRPMATQGDDFSGTLWFFTDRNSPKVRDVANNPSVNVVFMKSADESYLSLVGTAEVDNDRDRMRALWSPWMKSWFESAEDPDLCLLRVTVDEAEYWDTPGGKVASLFSLVKGAVTGDPGDMESDHGRVAF